MVPVALAVRVHPGGDSPGKPERQTSDAAAGHTDDAVALERLEADVRSTVLPDNDDTQDKHDWEWLAECLRNSGVQVSPHDHQGLPYDVAFSERLRARMVG